MNKYKLIYCYYSDNEEGFEEKTFKFTASSDTEAENNCIPYVQHEDCMGATLLKVDSSGEVISTVAEWTDLPLDNE